MTATAIGTNLDELDPESEAWTRYDRRGPEIFYDFLRKADHDYEHFIEREEEDARYRAETAPRDIRPGEDVDPACELIGMEGTFSYMTYIRPKETTVEDDWDLVEDAWNDIRTDSYEELWEEYSGDLIDIGTEGLAAGVFSAAALFLQSPELGVGALGFGTKAGDSVRKLHNSGEWDDIYHAIRYHWEDGDVPPAREDMVRLGEMDPHLYFGEATAAADDIDYLSEELGEQLERAADMVPDGYELRLAAFNPVIEGGC